jgi:hypothetical protein
MKAYLKQDIAKIINKTVGAVQSYVDKKLVYPDVLPAQGRGFTRAYSQRNLIEFAIIAVLLDSNQKFCLETIREILEIIRTDEKLKLFWDDTDEKPINFRITYPYDKGKNLIPCFLMEDKNYNFQSAMIEDSVSPPNIDIHLDKLRYVVRKRIGFKE